MNESGPRNPLLSSIFVNALLRAFGNGTEKIAMLGTESSPIAMGILRPKGLFQWETFQPSQAPLGAWIQCRETPLGELLSGLITALPGPCLSVGTSQMDPEVVARPEPTARLETMDHIATARIELTGDFDSYWATLDKNFRHQVARRQRRLADAGTKVELQILRDPASVEEAVHQYSELEQQGWKGALGTAVDAHNVQGTFYREVLTDYCRVGMGKIFRFLFDGRVAAMGLCVEYGSTLVVLKVGINEEYKTHAPGILMRVAYLRELFREGAIKRIELYGRASSSQLEFTSDTRKIYHASLYRWGFLRNLREQLRSYRKSEGAAAPVSVYQSISELPQSPRQLLERASSDGFSCSFAWYKNFASHAVDPSDSVRMYTVLAPTGRSAIGILPMVETAPNPAKRGRHLRALSNFYTPLTGLVVGGGQDAHLCARAIAATLVKDRPRWSSIDIHPVDPLSSQYEALVDALKSEGYIVHKYFCFGNWYLLVDGRSFAQYFSTLPSRLRNTIERKEGRLRASGLIRVDIIRSTVDLEPAIDAYERVYLESWKVPEPYPDFMRGFIKTIAEQGWLRLGLLYIGGEPAAAQVWIVQSQVAAIYKLAYSNRFARHSPGSILSAHLMKHVIDRDKVQSVDYLVGDDHYKKDWMTHRRERWGIVAYSPRTLSGLASAGKEFAGDTFRRLKRSFRSYPDNQSAK